MATKDKSGQAREGELAEDPTQDDVDVAVADEADALPLPADEPAADAPTQEDVEAAIAAENAQAATHDAHVIEPSSADE